jgi:hypothetical protein
LMLMTLLGVTAAAVTREAATDIDSVLYMSYRRLVPPDGS